MLSENIKALRTQAHLSQEQLAEQLHVSRQAVTKWETGAGTPDVENLRALAALFGTSLDELLEDDGACPAREHLYESVTEYDMDGEKRCDIVFSGAKRVTVMGYDGEKIRVMLASDEIPDVQRACKVRIDDIRKRLDVDIRRLEGLTEAKAKEALFIDIRLPQRYVDEIELAGNAGALVLRRLSFSRFEHTGKLRTVELDGVSGHVELNSNEDLDIRCAGLDGRLDVNQVSATSKLFVEDGAPFASVVRGIGNRIFYERGGAPCDDFSIGGDESRDCETVFELNGMKSELLICVDPQEA